jgi:hypothetical protein
MSPIDDVIWELQWVSKVARETTKAKEGSDNKEIYS